MHCQPKGFFASFERLVLIVYVVGFWGSGLSETSNLEAVQTAVFLLLFYRFVFIAVALVYLPETLNKFNFNFFLFFVLYFTSAWSFTEFTVNSGSAVVHSFILVFSFYFIVYSFFLNKNIGYEALACMLFFCILLGGIWVLFNGSMFMLWSWDPVEVGSLILFLSFVLGNHRWAANHIATYGLMALVSIRLFRAGFALSAHHLSVTSSEYTSYIPDITWDSTWFSLDFQTCAFLISCAAIAVFWTFSTAKLKPFSLSSGFNFKHKSKKRLNVTALLTSLLASSWLVLSMGPITLIWTNLMVLSIFVSIFRRKFRTWLLLPHILPGFAILFLFFGFFIDMSTHCLVWVN